MKDFESDWGRLLTDREADAREFILKHTRDMVGEMEKGTTRTAVAVEAWVKKYRQRLSLLKRNHLDDFNRVLNKNRFWLDDESYATLTAYVSAVYGFDALLKIPPEQWVEELTKKRAELERLRKNIATIRLRVLRGEDSISWRI